MDVNITLYKRIVPSRGKKPVEVMDITVKDSPSALRLTLDKRGFAALYHEVTTIARELGIDNDG